MASWIEGGGVSEAGRRRWRAASTWWRSSSKKAGRVIEGESRSGEVLAWPRKGAALQRPYEEKDRLDASRRFWLRFGIEGFGDDFAVGLAEENFDLAFGFFELLLALAGECDAFFKEFHGIVERKLRAFEFANNFFETREAAFEVG